MASTSATEPSPPPETNGVHVPTLPSNVSIFSPATTTTAEVLLSSRLFTRLTASPQSTGADGRERLASALRGMVSEGFCLLHGSAALVFDAGREGGEGVEDVHHEHVRAVCLALRDADVGLDIAGCVFDAPDSVRAGFQFDRLADGAVMVVDLMGGEDNDDDDDDDDGDGDDGDEGLERFLREAGTST